MGCYSEKLEGDGASKGNSLWYVGVILSIAGSVGTNMGVNLQKYSFMCEAKRSVNRKRTYFRQPMWVVGLVLVVAGSILDFVGLGFLPQSLATPVGGSTMIANIAFASLFLKEKFGRIDAIGTALVLIGICIVAAFAQKENACYTVSKLVQLYGQPLFLLYLTLVSLSCLALYWMVRRFERVLSAQGSSSIHYKKFARIHRVAYPALSGIFGAQSELFAKSVAELFKTTLEGMNQFSNVGTYLISVSMFSCIFLQIHWLAKGLEFFDAVFVVPVFQCFFISTAIFGGGVYFKEFSSLSTVSLVMFFFGVCVTLSGVSLLSQREMNVLKPSSKLRAVVKTVIFIKRAQKARNIEYRWVQPPGIESSTFVSKFQPRPHATPLVRLTKVSVVPIRTAMATT